MPLICLRRLANYVGILGLAYAGWAIADTSAKPHHHLTITPAPNGGMQLDVKNMPLPQVLDTVAAKTHIPIHYSKLSEDLVTAYCASEILKETLECLLARKADLLVRYPDTLNHASQIAEIWIVGSAPNTNPATGVTVRLPKTNARIGKILDKAQSPDPQERADAMASLLAEGNISDPAVTEALERALIDKDANVRSQALSSYAHNENSDAVNQAIRVALEDSSADVRLMAVDNISNDAELLQQALHDSDETIRSLATIKLNALVPENTN